MPAARPLWRGAAVIDGQLRSVDRLGARSERQADRPTVDKSVPKLTVSQVSHCPRCRSDLGRHVGQPRGSNVPGVPARRARPGGYRPVFQHSPEGRARPGRAIHGAKRGGRRSGPPWPRSSTARPSSSI